MYRGFLAFMGVTGMPSGIVSAKVRMLCSSRSFALGNPVIDLVDGTPANPILLTADDYDQVGATVLCGSPPTITATGVWYEWPLNAAGLAKLINGNILFAFRMTWDTANAAPTWIGSGQSHAGFESWTGSGNPELVITTTTISVRTDPATFVSSGNATLNGTLLEDGGDTPVTCYFDYGLTSACELGNIPVGGIVVTEGNSYLLVLTGLSPNTTYYFKAKAVGTSGATVYGSVLSFGSASYPSRPLTRVTAIHTVFRAGRGGQPGEYYQELLLGGLATEWIPALRSYQPTVGEGKKPGEMGINYKPVTFPPDMNALAKNMNMFFPQNQYRQYVKWRMAGGGDVSYTDWLKGAR